MCENISYELFYTIINGRGSAINCNSSVTRTRSRVPRNYNRITTTGVNAIKTNTSNSSCTIGCPTINLLPLYY